MCCLLNFFLCVLENNTTDKQCDIKSVSGYVFCFYYHTTVIFVTTVLNTIVFVCYEEIFFSN